MNLHQKAFSNNMHNIAYRDHSRGMLIFNLRVTWGPAKSINSHWITYNTWPDTTLIEYTQLHNYATINVILYYGGCDLESEKQMESDRDRGVFSEYYRNGLMLQNLFHSRELIKNLY